MKKILRDYYLLVLLVLLVGFFSKSAFAADMKVHYHCTADKAVLFESADGQLPMGQELIHTPEPGKSLNLTVGRFPNQYMFWIRKPFGQNKRFASVFRGSQLLPQSIELGEEGQAAKQLFSFQIQDGNELVNAQCEIEVE